MKIKKKRIGLHEEDASQKKGKTQEKWETVLIFPFLLPSFFYLISRFSLSLSNCEQRRGERKEKDGEEWVFLHWPLKVLCQLFWRPDKPTKKSSFNQEINCRKKTKSFGQSQSSFFFFCLFWYLTRDYGALDLWEEEEEEASFCLFSFLLLSCQVGPPLRHRRWYQSNLPFSLTR